ncbi:carnitine dehydratase [Sphingobium lactosutens]|uniref:CoA transferase n=1 Tax=Sphingobium lactosutens TaxID=522773 RepID=UPI0015BFF5ED|nr:CoA transferase [Sphingobium lactosutens]NWK97478.1 carnitine dehydratase [Sphingobium lactosutens]
MVPFDRSLSGLRIVEVASFVAGPSAGLHLAQLGADVIRVEDKDGGPDFRRWPLSNDGASFYWEGLNKGKRSLAIDLRSKDGRGYVEEIVTAAGDGAGILLTNLPDRSFLNHEELALRRPDLISVRIEGWPNGRTAVDYTVNAALGVPLITGASEGPPVNHVVPGWDLLMGAYAAFVVLAAHRLRCQTGQGQEIRLALGDIAAASLGHLGMIAEAVAGDGDRPRHGNNLFGAFGRDFITADGEHIMIVAVTPGQWKALVAALALEDAVKTLEQSCGANFADEASRFIHRDALNALVSGAVARLALADLESLLRRHGACFDAYRPLAAAAREVAGPIAGNPIFSEIEQVSKARYPVAATIARFTGERRPPAPAGELGRGGGRLLIDLCGAHLSIVQDLVRRNILRDPEVGE